MGDISDAEGLKVALRRSDANCVLNLAAVTAGTSREIADPVEVVRVNIGGAAATVEAAAACGIRRVLHLSFGLCLRRQRARCWLAHGRYATASRTALWHHQTSQRSGPRCGSPICIGSTFRLAVSAHASADGNMQPPRGIRRVHRIRSCQPPDRAYRRSCRAHIYATGSMRGMQRAAVLELLYARTRRHLVYNLAAGFMWSIADFLRPATTSLLWLRMAFRPERRVGQHRLLRALRSLCDGYRAPARRHQLPTSLQSYGSPGRLSAVAWSSIRSSSQA